MGKGRGLEKHKGISRQIQRKTECKSKKTEKDREEKLVCATLL